MLGKIVGGGGRNHQNSKSFFSWGFSSSSVCVFVVFSASNLVPLAGP